MEMGFLNFGMYFSRWSEKCMDFMNSFSSCYTKRNHGYAGSNCQ